MGWIVLTKGKYVPAFLYVTDIDMKVPEINSEGRQELSQCNMTNIEPDDLW